VNARTDRIEITARSIADSRGDPTVEVEIRLGVVAAVASAPAGKTKGGDEARTVPIAHAISNVHEVILPLVRTVNADLSSHRGLIEVEQRLIERAGANCIELGANALLPVSIALWRCAAQLHGLELYEYIRAYEPELAGFRRVRLFSNVLNGGYHALRKDPLQENDWDGLERLATEIKERGVMVVGDDFYVTQKSRLEKGIAAASANGLLVKPNQNGSLHGTIEVMKLARRHGIELVISHRSGETLDDTIADLAVAVGAFGIKAGAPQPESIFPDPVAWVRRKKYLRLIAIDEGRE